MNKKAGESQVAWALLTEGVSQARLETHRLRHLLKRTLTLVENSKAKDHLYQVAGDMIVAAPRRLEALEAVLDRTSYALALFGSDHLRDRLSISDRALIDESTHKSNPFKAPSVNRSSLRVAERYLMRQADLVPALGFPGGPCHLVQRILSEVSNPRLRDELIEDVERGLKLDNAVAAKVYEVESEQGVGKFKRILISPHAQYRMDQRGVTVPEVRLALKTFQKAWNDERSRKSPKATRWEKDMAYGEPILWTDPTTKLSTVFAFRGDAATLVTTYWEGQPDPKPVGEGSCPTR